MQIKKTMGINGVDCLYSTNKNKAIHLDNTSEIDENIIKLKGELTLVKNMLKAKQDVLKKIKQKVATQYETLNP